MAVDLALLFKTMPDYSVLIVCTSLYFSGLSPTTTFCSFSVFSDFSWCSCFLSLVFTLLLDSFGCFMCQSFFYCGPNKIYSEFVRIRWLWTQWRLSPLTGAYFTRCLIRTARVYPKSGYGNTAGTPSSISLCAESECWAFYNATHQPQHLPLLHQLVNTPHLPCEPSWL